MSDDQLYTGSAEQPGSQRAYERDREIQRRNDMRAASLQLKQIEAAEAGIRASNAIVSNSKWIRSSAIAVILGTIVAIATFALTLI